MKLLSSPSFPSFAALAALALSGALPTRGRAADAPPVNEARLVPFPVNWKATGASAIDLSGLLDAPAGKGGFITAAGGHFAKPDGTRIRFWGVNLTGAGALPTHANAELLAAGLARRGINCVRLHMLDSRWNGLFPRNATDTLSLDPERLDRLDFFIAALKRRGIYVDLNLNVARIYRPGDGVRDADLLGFAKSVTYFDERILALQRDYARQLLTHRNPYTGTAYANEPAVALVEFVNENSLIEAWFGGRLDGHGTQKNPGTWADIPASYAADLTAKYNESLARNVPAATLAAWRAQAGVAEGAALPRLASKEIAKADRERFHAEARFYLALERDFFLGMAKFLRDELHVHALFAGNSDHGHSKTGYPQLSGTALLDVVDSHTYWQHPNYLTEPGTTKRTGYRIGNTAMVDDPLHSSVVELSRSAFAGKPFTVSEVNHPFPAERAAEGIPILAAYAALQDWDGIFWYTLLHADLDEMNSSVAGHFDLAMDPGRLAQLAPGALLFLRGDVTAARATLVRTYTREQVIDSIRLGNNERPYFTPGFPLALPLTQAVRIGSFDGPPTAAFPAIDSSAPLRSDTRELTWQSAGKHTGLVTIDTPRSQAVIGFVTGDRVSAGQLGLRLETPFCAVTLSALDAAPIAQARRLLLTATARTANTGQTWNDARNSTVEWGSPPARTELVRGEVTLSGLAAAKKITITALDSTDQPAGEIAPRFNRGDPGGWTFALNADGTAPAIAWIIEVAR